MPLLSQTLPNDLPQGPVQKQLYASEDHSHRLSLGEQKKHADFEGRASLPNYYEFLILIPRQFLFSFFKFL
jgi:hypothetical protein